MKTLIIYGTRRGTTTETAQVIGETLVLKCGHEVEMTNITNIRQFRNKLVEYNNIIVGSSIVGDRWIGKVLRFLKNNSFEGQKVALFVTAGSMFYKLTKENNPREELIREVIQRYLDPYLEIFKFKPVAKYAFGSAVQQKSILKYSSWDRKEIEDWTIKVGEIFNSEPLNITYIPPVYLTITNKKKPQFFELRQKFSAIW